LGMAVVCIGIWHFGFTDRRRMAWLICPLLLIIGIPLFWAGMRLAFP
jgi:hypothetical protein